MSLILDSINIKYYTRNIRDIETIHCIKNNQIYINYSRIVNTFKNNVRAFAKVIMSTQFLEDLRIYAGRKPCVKPLACCRNNNISFNREESFNNVKELLNEVDFFFSVTGNITVRGTFGPIDFIDSILFNLSPDYRQEVHNLMNSIQNLADANNSSFIETLQKIIEELQNRVRELETRLEESKRIINDREEHIDYLNSELYDRDEYIENLEEDLESSNEIYEETVNNYENIIERLDH